MRIHLTDELFEIRLSRAEKIFGLMRDIRVPRASISGVELVERPLREAMSAGLKAGVRVPYLYFIARTINLEQVFLVRRGVPALGFSVSGQEPLRHVIVSTPEAATLAAQLEPASQPGS